MSSNSRHQCILKEKNILDDNGEFLEREYKYNIPKVINSDIGWQLMTGWKNPTINRSSSNFSFPQFEIIKK